LSLFFINFSCQQRDFIAVSRASEHDTHIDSKLILVPTAGVALGPLYILSICTIMIVNSTNGFMPAMDQIVREQPLRSTLIEKISARLQIKSQGRLAGRSK
jgi:hypothetical protein